jgi:hypothetical protein
MWKTTKTKGGDAACALPRRDFLPRRTICFALLFLCLLAYRGVLDNWLFNDDFSWLRAARLEMTARNLLAYRVVDFFRPLVNLSFWLMEKASPGNVPLHYGFNILLHALCAILYFHLLAKLLGNDRLSLAAAALFAVTSVHAAAVLWISARTTLLSTVFLLAALRALLSERRAGAIRIAGACGLYALALASKEEAIAGLLLAALIFALARRRPGAPRIDGRALAALASISALYLIVRHAFLGGIFRENWGLGAHALRNVAGGFLYQLYPWPFFSLFHPAGTHIAEPADALMPEILVVPLAVLLVAAGRAARRTFAMNLAVAWGLLALAPAALFRYRFFSTVSFSQSRYYYLSSAGTVLVIVLLLSMLWRGRSRARRVLAAILFLLISAGYVERAHRIERKWDEFTAHYRGIVAAIVEESDARAETSRLAIENPPMAFDYLADAIVLERPDRTVVAVGTREEAERQAPCLYVSYSGEAPKIMRVERIDRPAGGGEGDAEENGSGGSVRSP